MGHRVLQIKNYKNVGINEKQELLLNVSTEKGEMGGIVLLVGPNNSGKTNILHALTSMHGKFETNFDDLDLPDFDMSKPELEISLVYFDNKDTYGFSKTYVNGKQKNRYFTNIKGDSRLLSVSHNIPEKFRIFASKYINAIKRHGRISNLSNLEAFQRTFSQVDAKGLYTGDVEEMGEILKSLYGSTTYNYNFIHQFVDSSITTDEIESIINTFTNKPAYEEQINELETNKKFDILPAISLYHSLNFKNSQLQSSPEDIKNSDLFKLVFKAIDFNIEELLNTYERVKNQSMPGLLKNTASEINKKLDGLSDQFNKLFQSNSNKYKFEITLETNQVYLTIYLNDTVLHLDKQSTGFRWFFEFYFTLMATSTLKRGDIIVMDEPATNLHTSGVVELRKFIKSFAEKNELTFVISTHNPFFVDLNFLEEVRVVNRKGEFSEIQSKFHFVDENDNTDSLRPIKDALTVPRHVLVDPNVSTVFVEGITDYLYLTAFAQLLKIKDYIFLPIQGVSKSNLLEILSKIERNPIILVDNDKAGNQVKEKAEKAKYKNVEVIKLSEIDPRFTTIESLFDPSDRLEKSFVNASIFKNRLLKKAKISSVTKNNFENLLKNILV